MSSCFDDGDASGAAKGKLRMKANGEPFIGEATALIKEGQNVFFIEASDGAEDLQFAFGNEMQPGSFKVKDTDGASNRSHVLVTYSDARENFYVSSFTPTTDGAGTIVITDYDKDAKTLSDTFTATLTSADGKTVIELTEGSFTEISISPL